MKGKFFVLAVSLILMISMTSGLAAALEDPPYAECPPPIGCRINITEPLMGYYSGGIIDVSWIYTPECYAHNYNLNYKLGECSINPSGWTHIDTVGYAENTDFPWDVTGLGVNPEACELYCLEVVDENWDPDKPLSGRGTTSLYIDNVAPEADANGPYETYENVDVLLEATGSDNCDAECILEYRWDLGSGWTDWSIDPTVMFDATCLQGIFTVNVEIKDCAGNIGSDSATVEVMNKAPIVDAYGPYFGQEDDEFVPVSGSATDECDSESIQYCWSWDGDTTCETDWSYSSEENFPSLCNEGVHTIYLVATDGEDEGYDDTTVTISNVKPTAEADGPYYGNEGSAIIFDGSGSSDVCDTVQYCWDWDNNDVCDTDWSYDPTAENSWCDNGEYIVQLFVTDGTDMDDDTADVTVYNVAPTVWFLNEPYEGVKGEPIVFTAAFDDEGKCDADWTYKWDWTNDGSFDTTGSKGTIENIVTPHTYSDRGPYTVLIEVCDKDGDCGIATTEVEVHDYVIILHPGLNFVSIPLVPLGDDVSSANVLSQLTDAGVFEEAWYMNIHGNWQVIPETGFYDMFDEIMPGIGFYLFVDGEFEEYAWYGDGNKMYQNPQSHPPSIMLVDGWQMVGHYGLISDLPEIQSFESLQTITYDSDGLPISIVKHYSTILDEFGNMQDTTEVGVGRWIHMRLDNWVGDEIWYIPSTYAY